MIEMAFVQGDVSKADADARPTGERRLLWRAPQNHRMHRARSARR